MDIPTIPTNAITPHRYGEFWDVNKQGRYSISRVSIGVVADGLGFRLYRGELYRIIGITIHLISDREFQDALRAYIEPSDQHGMIVNALEQFLQTNGKYTISRLPIITREAFLNDDADTCYKFFRNGYMKITADSIEPIKYDAFPKDKCVLFSSIQPREYHYNDTGKYFEFLYLATPFAKQRERIQQIIGYLAHQYKDETTGYIIVLIEQCADPKDGGGSGKNIFCNLLSYTTTYHSKNGSQAKYDEKFFQSWNGQRIMGISDVPKNFQYQFLKEPSTGTFILKKLFRDEVEIPVADGPKFIIQTQFSYEISDGGLRRRIIPIEFSDFFTKCGGVDVHFGCHFPLGWSTEDWNGFDTLIIDSVQLWLKCGRKLTTAPLTETGWQKQFEFTYHKTISQVISEKIDKWRALRTITVEDLNVDLGQYYQENKIPPQFQPNKNRFNDALEEYCRHYNIPLKVNAVIKLPLGVAKRCYLFDTELPD